MYWGQVKGDVYYLLQGRNGGSLDLGKGFSPSRHAMCRGGKPFIFWLKRERRSGLRRGGERG